jgi:2-dehydro-3-deoxygluconokinase
MLSPDDVKEEYLSRAKMLHFSEAMLRKNQTREIVIRVLETAKRNGVKVSYDPNTRESLWNTMEEFREVQRRVLGYTDIFLSTSKEACLIAGGKGIAGIIENILALGPSIIIIRQKRKYHLFEHGKKYVIPVFQAEAVDTSGAGDVFTAGFICGIVKGITSKKAIMLGSAAAAIKVATHGTRGGLPNMDDVRKFLKKRANIDL